MPTPEPYDDTTTLGTPTGSTMANGAPAESDLHSLSLSPDGPLLLHDMHLVDTLAHFNRENIPERKPHAKGSGAFGTFECTEDVSRYTKASVLQQGATCRTLARFSTVAGELGSPDTWRDVRGFSLRFYTDEGNWDMVGNNTPVFFVRDPMKFPHFIRSQKRLAASGLRDGTMQWDFWTNSPESAHQVTYLMGDRGLPRSWRTMNGYGSHTYMTSNAAGERFWVKFHFHSDQGVENLTNEEAERLSGADSDFHRRDLFEAIENGDNPSWTMYIQAMPYEDAKTYRFNPFDLTKVWPHEDYPLVKVGTFTLNENPANHFAQIEQAAFAPSNVVPGIGFSPDKMLLARVFSYADAHRARVGANAHLLPVNRPIPEVEEKANHLVWDGPMNSEVKTGPTYVPNSDGRGHSAFAGTVPEGWEADGEIVRQAYTLHSEDDDWGQAGRLVREVFDDAQRDRFVDTVAGALGGVREDVLERAFVYWKNVDAETGERIEAKVRSDAGGPIPGMPDEEKNDVREPLPEPAGAP
ncbi:catalase [Phycicoccus sp. CSK15P-2]|uniref:catalase n=1 Tax=Phycicoccus sp. CSK15P-2 TaxID=2807627 RepID=UPI00194DF6F0|nr:catalase [Phycicoccus sp. CSK15P-2]MBM6403683.1 catalase [Phycicoccus sp. CSK15P-2]